MKKIKPELSDYQIAFNRREQRNELHYKGLWLIGVKRQSWIPWGDLLEIENPENKLYFYQIPEEEENEST